MFGSIVSAPKNRQNTIAELSESNTATKAKPNAAELPEICEATRNVTPNPVVKIMLRPEMKIAAFVQSV